MVQTTFTPGSRLAQIVVSACLGVVPSSQFRNVLVINLMFWIPDCGNVLTPGAVSISASQCNSTCIGDYSETCGGPLSLDLYASGATPPPQPTYVQSVDSWYYLGCFR